jgi:predicted RNase H-like HicB family nuclease
VVRQRGSRVPVSVRGVEEMNFYKVRYQRDRESGWWVAQVKEVPATITQGRTIAEARRRIREALALALDDDTAATKAELINDVKLPPDARRALARARADRKRLEIETRRTRATTAAAVQKLIKSVGLRVRDAGELLGISHQRVQQIARHKKQSRTVGLA